MIWLLNWHTFPARLEIPDLGSQCVGRAPSTRGLGDVKMERWLGMKGGWIPKLPLSYRPVTGLT